MRPYPDDLAMLTVSMTLGWGLGYHRLGNHHTEQRILAGLEYTDFRRSNVCVQRWAKSISVFPIAQVTPPPRLRWNALEGQDGNCTTYLCV
jgi:hypothetical protein